MSFSPAKSDNRSAGLLLRKRVLLAVGLLAFVGGTLVFPFPMQGPIWGDIFDLAHAPVFCGALICLVAFLDPQAAGFPGRFKTIVPMTTGRIALTTIVVMLVGLTGEYLQKFAGRNPSWGDVFANTAGLTAALSWLGSRRRAGTRKVALMLAAPIIIAAVSLSPILQVTERIVLLREFPQLASFERARELDSWTPHQSTIARSDDWSSDGSHSLKVNLSASKYPGVAMHWFNPRWSSYSGFEFDAHNPSDVAVTLIVKLQDELHVQTGFQYEDRFHQPVVLHPNSTAHVVVDLAEVRKAPANREMNMEEINMIDLFCPNPTNATSVYFDDLRLTRHRPAE